MPSRGARRPRFYPKGVKERPSSPIVPLFGPPAATGLAPEDAVEASVAAALLRSVGGSATEFDAATEELLEVYVEATASWVVDFDGRVFDVDAD